MRSKRIQLTLHTGSPFGIRTAELSNWNGKIIVCPRIAVKQLNELPESELPAVYFLLGDGNKVYVGETDTLAARIGNHVANKEFWNEFVALTSSTLTKTEVKYLEYFLAKKLKEDGVADVQNSTEPRTPTISRASIDILDEFVDIASDILLSLGFHFLSPSREIAREAEKGIVVYCKGPKAEATGVYSDDGLLVRAGALFRIEETLTIPNSIKVRRAQMKESGVIIEEGESYRLLRDVLFPSPSTASDVVLGRNSNGRREWKNGDDKTINEFEE